MLAAGAIVKLNAHALSGELLLLHVLSFNLHAQPWAAAGAAAASGPHCADERVKNDDNV